MKSPQLLILSLFFISIAYSFKPSIEKSEDLNVRIVPVDTSLRFELTEEEFDDPFWGINFEFDIINDSKTSITIIKPKAHSISPHPWIESINEIELRKPNRPICGNSLFKESDKIEIRPGEKHKMGYSRVLGAEKLKGTVTEYRIKLKYEFEVSESNAFGVTITDLTELKTAWSEEVIIQIIG